MGWRGFVRAVGASNRRAARATERAARAYDREQQRRYREAQKNLAASAKADALYRASMEVQEYETRLAVLRTVHSESLAPIDWRYVLQAPPPPPPVYTNHYEMTATQAYHQFQPGFFANLFGNTDAERARLQTMIEDGRRQDAEYNHRVHDTYVRAQQQTEWLRHVARGVLAGDVLAFRTALDWRDVFGELEELGSSATIETLTAAFVEVDLFVNSDDVIPGEVKTLLASGKLSKKKMPVAQTNDIYQDYVCSSALRVGREIFATIPVRSVLVHAIGEMLNSATGHMEHEAILSVHLVRETMQRLNFSAIDASDSMKNFQHVMKFQKTKGFARVEPLVFDPRTGQVIESRGARNI